MIDVAKRMPQVLPPTRQQFEQLIRKVAYESRTVAVGQSKER